MVEVGRCSSQPLSHSLRYGRSRRSRGRKTGSGRDGMNGYGGASSLRFYCEQNLAEKLRHSDICVFELRVCIFIHTPVDRWNHDTPRYADDTFTRTKTPYLTYVYL